MQQCKISISKEIEKILPITYDILKNSNLSTHAFVYKIVLSGSRGLLNNFREDSDIDLSLLVDSHLLNAEQNQEKVLKEILDVTMSNWKSKIELDTVAVFDINNCGLDCFENELYSVRKCKRDGIDCFGLYKLQKGFHGYIFGNGIEVELIHPIISVWERTKCREI